MPRKITQYASTIIRGVDTYFLCRLLSCRAFMPSTQWIQEFVVTPEFKGKFWGPPPPPSLTSLTRALRWHGVTFGRSH